MRTRSDFLPVRRIFPVMGWFSKDDEERKKMSAVHPQPGATDLLTLFGAEHSLGGIVGYEVAETTDENPERVAVVQRMSTAYLRSALRVSEGDWGAVRAAFADSVESIGRVDSR